MSNPDGLSSATVHGMKAAIPPWNGCNVKIIYPEDKWMFPHEVIQWAQDELDTAGSNEKLTDKDLERAKEILIDSGKVTFQTKYMVDDGYEEEQFKAQERRDKKELERNQDYASGNE